MGKPAPPAGSGDSRCKLRLPKWTTKIMNKRINRSIGCINYHFFEIPFSRGNIGCALAKKINCAKILFVDGNIFIVAIEKRWYCKIWNFQLPQNLIILYSHFFRNKKLITVIILLGSMTNTFLCIAILVDDLGRFGKNCSKWFLIRWI